MGRKGVKSDNRNTQSRGGTSGTGRGDNDEAAASTSSVAHTAHDMSRGRGGGRHLGRRRVVQEKNYGLTFLIVTVGLVAIVAYYVWLGYLETRIYTPLDQEKVIDQNDGPPNDRFWGTFRPGFYFGLKHMSPKSLTAGLMWLLPSQLKPNSPGLRHQCQQGDNLEKYGWLQHDGVNFGVQEIVDVDTRLTTSFIKQLGGINGGDWTARINVDPLSDVGVGDKDVGNQDEIVLIFYVALEPDMSGEIRIERDLPLSSIFGFTEDLGHFGVRFVLGGNVLKSANLVTKIRSLNDISHVALQNMISRRHNNKWLYHFQEDLSVPDDSNIIMWQVHVKGPFSFEVVFESASFLNRISTLSGDTYTKRLQKYQKEFSAKFENTFHLKKKGFNNTAIAFAQAALSNLIGGIGYFYGSSRVQSTYNNVPVLYWPAALYSAVPSRSFFPRGFLWDEGFHLLLINKWSAEISLDIISHWLDLMNIEGWIPREQILGEEAHIRVPEEYVVQKNDNANPPTLIIAMADLLARDKEWLHVNHKETLYKIWPRLVTWYSWLNKTQSGEVPFAYRWRGRNETTIRELNPKTLASGLDDYPRASHPSSLERHLDLRCWMAAISKLMQELAEILGFDHSKYSASYQALTNLKLLNEQHWSAELEAYTDYGLHTNNVGLKYPPLTEAQVKWQEQTHQQIQREKLRATFTPPKYGYVNMFGYVNLFPVLMQVLPRDSPQLLFTLQKLSDPNYLWTPFGLRSLAANSPLYDARNTEHDPPYWRGSIWININFLALKSLKYYSDGDGEVNKLANNIYLKLRQNLMNNMMKQYYRTGYLWEHYNDKTGAGEGCRPFTGWSSLVVLIMAEEY